MTYDLMLNVEDALLLQQFYYQLPTGICGGRYPSPSHKWLRCNAFCPLDDKAQMDRKWFLVNEATYL